MKIKSIEVVGLNGSQTPIKLDFNEDLNIITGRNGAGKTTLLKLIWYVISGNFELVFEEINFIEATIVTTDYIFNIKRDNLNVIKEIHTNWLKPEPQIISFNALNQSDYDKKLAYVGSSLFLPTFRRLEGGFLTERKIVESALDFEKIKTLEQALTTISQKLSVQKHHFITSVGTNDVNSLLLQRYAEVSDFINTYQEDLNKTIINQIQQTKDNEKEVLADIQNKIELLEIYRNEAMKPFNTLKEVLSKFIKHSDIRLTELSIAESNNNINQLQFEQLSAGEKQILSFLVYNTFYQDTIFIIDEPELSLHVDWQRQLFPTLMKQGSTNQFIVATHSPFIYSKYPDKELPITTDKGDNEEHE